MSVKNNIGILIGTELNLQVAFGRMVISTLILPTHKHGKSFYLPMSSLIFFFSV